MIIFIRLLGANIVDSLKFDNVENSTTIAEIKKLVHQETNLTPTDKVICYFNNVELTSNDITLWDLSVRNNQTITMVIERDTHAEKFKVLKPKELGVFKSFINEKGEHQDTLLAHIFSFLTAKDIALSIELTCRRFRIATIAHHDIAWEPLVRQLYARHDAASSPATIALLSKTSSSAEKEDAEIGSDEKESKTILHFKGMGIDCRKLYKQTIVIEKVWEHIKMLTPNQQSSGVFSLEKQRDLLNTQIAPNVRQVKIKRKPKELTAEDEEFLKQHDLKKLKLDVRSRAKKSKEEREADLERYSRFKRLSKRKEEMEHGTWQVVPEHLLTLSYEELMKHSFSFRNNNVFGFYNDRGQYFIVKNKDELLYVGELEIVGDKFKIAHILCNNSQLSDKQIAQEFFQYMAQCTTSHIEEKKLIHLSVNPKGVQGLFVDAILDVLITLRKFEQGQATTTCERPRIEVKEPEKSLEKKSQQMGHQKGPLQHSVSTIELTDEEKNDPEFDRFTFNATVMAFKEEEGIDASMECLVETYVAAFIQALKHDSVGTLGLPLCEQVFFRKLKKEEEETSKFGIALARAVTKYLQETEKTRTQQGAGSSSSAAAAEEEELSVEESLRASSKKKKKKVFRKMVLAVENEEDKQRVISNIASFYETH
ncbi:hypothetical protein C9374_000274 [Naegleria lovaniensis]|uniref:Ubiquitin-like domain-containing protein n=1 Tax=Naegleria lovaniensis TaxID=51637 RepID=A0AA88GTY5_NAELO|nr:uncharacterized protein C9374_000274 [Naegleria lovaniensis]KAG2388835.1 hypothetical protein C9374_000274 [Naegleria lovaniensis]